MAGVEYHIPQADGEEDTHSAATIEQMDEEIEVDADVSMPQEIAQTPQRASLNEEHEEDVDIDGETSPPIHDKYWEAAHPNSLLTTPLTREAQSHARTEEIHTGSEESQPSLQYIPEEIPAATADETAQDDLIFVVINTTPPRTDSIPSADTNTVMLGKLQNLKMIQPALPGLSLM